MFVKRLILVKTTFTSAMLLSAMPVYAVNEQPAMVVNASPDDAPSATGRKATLFTCNSASDRDIYL
ncbi:hypothetical protein DBY66_004720 [Pantoea sp. RIT413]|nr:hypothetical protein DBY66_004720 [Pantoea sp. RIT 413]